MERDEFDEIRATERGLRGIRVLMLVLYLLPGIAIAFSGRPAAPYVVALLAVMGTVGTVSLTIRARVMLAPYRDPATGELPFDRSRLRLADVIPLPSALRKR